MENVKDTSLFYSSFNEPPTLTLGDVDSEYKTCHAVKLESPCRIDMMSEEAHNNFVEKYLRNLKIYFKHISIEEPLLSAKERGVHYVVIMREDKYCTEQIKMHLICN